MNTKEKGGHYRSEGFVCLFVISRACADNRADAVDRLLILKVTMLKARIGMFILRIQAFDF